MRQKNLFWPDWARCLSLIGKPPGKRQPAQRNGQEKIGLIQDGFEYWSPLENRRQLNGKSNS